jgi:hypothetical protein
MRGMPTGRCRAARAGGALGAGLLTLILAGCGKDPEPLVPVKGKVQDAAGKPVANVVLTFHPQEEVNKGKLASALADKEGRFSTECIRGRYKITVAVPPRQGHADPSGGPVAAPPKSGGPSIDPSYRAPERTPLEVEVPAGGKEDVRLVVR